MTTFKRTFMLISGLMACLVGSLAAIGYYYGALALVAVVFTLLSVVLFSAVCLAITWIIMDANK
jgi:hypothetical protein